jgi:hypothetical protein
LQCFNIEIYGIRRFKNVVHDYSNVHFKFSAELVIFDSTSIFDNSRELHYIKLGGPILYFYQIGNYLIISFISSCRVGRCTYPIEGGVPIIMGGVRIIGLNLRPHRSIFD